MSLQLARMIALPVVVVGLAACVGGPGVTTALQPEHASLGPAGYGSATVQWSTPTTNVDGSPLTNLAGYKVRYGQSPISLSQLIDVPSPEITRLTIGGLAPGTWYFTVASYTSTGVESHPAGPVPKTIP